MLEILSVEEQEKDCVYEGKREREKERERVRVQDEEAKILSSTNFLAKNLLFQTCDGCQPSSSFFCKRITKVVLSIFYLNYVDANTAIVIVGPVVVAVVGCLPSRCPVLFNY